MKRIVTSGLVCVLLLTATGCGSPDALMKELISNLNVLAEVIEKKESKEKVQAAIERVNATADKINRLKLSAEEEKKLFQRYDDELKKVAARLEEAQKTRKLEGTGDDLPHIAVENYIKK